MWVHPKLSHMIKVVGYDRGGHTQWITLTNIPGGDIGLLNICAPRTSRERHAFWEELLVCLPSNCKWALIGDWNFVEFFLDKSNHIISHLSGEEKKLFNALKQGLQVKDVFPNFSSIRFTWDNRRRSTGRVLTQLDCTYSFKGVRKRVSNVDYRIFGDSAHSDHLPIWRLLWIEEESKRQSPYVMSSLFLSDPIVQSKIKEIWHENPTLPFFGKIRKCVKFFKEFCIRKAAERRVEEGRIRQCHEEKGTRLQYDPDNLEVQSELALM